MLEGCKNLIKEKGTSNRQDGKKIEIHSQSGGNHGKVTNVHAQYRVPKHMTDRYAQVASLLNTAGTEGIVIKSASIFVNGGPISDEDPSSPTARQFLGKHMDTNCIVTLFAAISKDRVRVSLRRAFR